MTEALEFIVQKDILSLVLHPPLVILLLIFQNRFLSKLQSRMRQQTLLFPFDLLLKWEKRSERLLRVSFQIASLEVEAGAFGEDQVVVAVNMVADSHLFQIAPPWEAKGEQAFADPLFLYSPVIDFETYGAGKTH